MKSLLIFACLLALSQCAKIILKHDSHHRRPISILKTSSHHDDHHDSHQKVIKLSHHGHHKTIKIECHDVPTEICDYKDKLHCEEHHGKKVCEVQKVKECHTKHEKKCEKHIE